MPWGYDGLAQLAAKVQSAFGTVETTLDISNVVAMIPDQTSVAYKQEKTDIRLASTVFGNQLAVYGQSVVEITAAFPVGVTGSSTEPHISNWMKCSGWKLTTATKKHTYEPSALYTDWKDMYVNYVSGDKESGDAILLKAGNCMFGFKIACAKIGEPTIATFTGMGIPTAVPAATTYISGTQTLPSDTYIPLMSAGTVSIGGQTFRLLSYELTWDAKVKIIGDAANAYGCYRAIIGNDPVCRMKMTVLAEQFASLTPWATSKTAGTLTIVYGATADSKISITSDSNKFFFDPPTITNQDGIATLDIEGTFIDNACNFIINEA
jgi:hypothetical protein